MMHDLWPDDYYETMEPPRLRIKHRDKWKKRELTSERGEGKVAYKRSIHRSLLSHFFNSDHNPGPPESE